MKLEIELSYKYSKLDKCHEFGITMTPEHLGSAYCNWIWYYLGIFLGEKRKYSLYQFSVNKSPFDGKILKVYSGHGFARTPAKLIENRINKIVKNGKV